jgi:CRISPR-associated endonuclease/helicase Cas3
LERASWLLAGLVVLADWIGSSQTWFPYHTPKPSLPDYWEQVAIPNAQRALDAAGLEPAASASHLDYARMTGVAGFTPTPMQLWASHAPIAPGLYIIEDSTGAGKTEAALMLAHRLIAAGVAEGLYIALPTMATADGMFGRMGRMYRNLFTGALAPSLALAHGARDLHLGFQAAVRIPDPDTGSVPDADRAEDVSYCNAWIADDRRKAFLAQVGVGSIDQALLSILPAYHQSLRVLGLAQRVLVLDEVHAYDAYMNQEIIRLLEMQAALGGTTILLSGTLPVDTKARLLRAYGGRVANFSLSYPLATVVTTSARGCARQDPVRPRAETVRRVPLSFVISPDEGMRRVITAARGGQAVLYIRNTVRDAIETFQSIPQEFDAQLFHARFAMCDRHRIQDDVIKRFGPDGTYDQRKGQILISTQVVEQSLDLDFDLIVTDLAPIDLIIQRAGRLWRHARNDSHPHCRRRAESAKCEMVIVGPSPDPAADKNWLRRALLGTSFVYKDHARMWLTAQALHNCREINAPRDLRPLVEHVYGPEGGQQLPVGLGTAFADAGVQSGTERAAAIVAMLKVENGYVRSEPWDSDERVITRLGANAVTLRLAVAREGHILPWAATRTDETDLRRQWALSEVALRGYSGGDAIPANMSAAAAVAKSIWTAWQRDAIPLVVVRHDGTISTGLQYSPRLGLVRAA